jgi:hypothetical protein
MATSISHEPGDPRLIIRWARRYAKSRTISFLVQWALIVFMLLGIWITASLTHLAYLQESHGLVAASLAAMILGVLVLLWFSISRWGGEFIWRITLWLYGGEGYAEYTSDARQGAAQWWITVLGVGLVGYHVLAAFLITFNHLPLRLMQPFSALYMVPFLAALIRLQGLGLWAWVWPALYAAHAGLVFSGAQVLFTGNLELLNMAIPVFGYGLIAILTGHVYSRFALWKLKRLSRSGLPQPCLVPQAEE